MEKKWVQNEGTFSLRRNPTKKDEESKLPDFVGLVVIQGVEYELSGWSKLSSNGGRWISGTIKPPYSTGKKATNEPDESNIPF